jgi:hypothetical protein
VPGVGYKRGGLDAAADLQLVVGDEPVADDADGGGHAKAEMGGAPLGRQPVEADHAREHRARPDHEDHTQPGQVLGPLEP